MFKKLIILSFLLALIIPFKVEAERYYSQGSGVFSQTSLWNNLRDGTGVDPKNGDFNNGNHSWIIQEGDTVRVDGKWRNITVIVEGYLILEPGQDFQPGDSLIIQSTGTIDYNFESIDLLNTVLISSGEQLNKDFVLPVTLKYFKGYRSENKVYLNWATASEKENYGFWVYRDNIKIGFVQGQGSTTNETLYAFEDNPSNSRHYYHLLQEDFDGDKKIYGPLKIKSITKITVQKTKDFIEIKIEDKPNSKVTIYNFLGQKIEEFYVNNSFFIHRMSRKNRAVGIYFLIIISNGKEETIIFNY